MAIIPTATPIGAIIVSMGAAASRARKHKEEDSEGSTYTRASFSNYYNSWEYYLQELEAEFKANKPIHLKKKDKKYLVDFLHTFGHWSRYIYWVEKKETTVQKGKKVKKYEYLAFSYGDFWARQLVLPKAKTVLFKAGTKYKKLELNKKYTLYQLGVDCTGGK